MITKIIKTITIMITINKEDSKVAPVVAIKKEVKEWATMTTWKNQMEVAVTVMDKETKATAIIKILIAINVITFLWKKEFILKNHHLNTIVSV